MGYWHEVRDVVLKGIDLAVDGVREGAETAAMKGKDSLTYAQLKKDLFLEQRKLHDHLADLGDAVHDLYREKKDIYTDEKVKGIMESIIIVEDRCRDFEKRLGELWTEKKKPEQETGQGQKEEKESDSAGKGDSDQA